MRWIWCASVIAVMSGCHAFTVDVDGQIAQRAAQPIDVQPTPTAAPQKELPSVKATVGKPFVDSNLMQARFQDKEAQTPKITPPKKEKREELYERITKHTYDIVGGDSPAFQMKAGATPEERGAVIKKYFPDLTTIPKQLPTAQPGPDGRPMTLTDLQQLALRTNPLVRQAHLDVEAAQGIARQAGAYPNPSIGYEASTVGQGNTDGQRSPGQQGGFFEQTIITMGKLTLAREAALRDVAIAEQRLRQVESDLQGQVRTGYFALLSAQKNFETNRSLSLLTDELYNVMLQQWITGDVAAYEPMQIRVLANQVRNTLMLAQNRYRTAWKQLAATLGVPTMPLTVVAGKIDMDVPHFDHDKVLEHVLSRHTDVLSAALGVEKFRLLTRLAEVQPYPDVTVHVAFQKDYTTPPFSSVANVNVSVPFPLWNRNQGGIQAARAQWRRTLDDNQRVRNDLTSKVAEAFEHYDNNRKILDLYRKQILPNQVQAYRQAVLRHAAVGDKDKVSYNDLVTSQQTLASLIATYLGALSDQWTAVVDIGNLLQTRDLFQVQAMDEVEPIPDLHEIHRGGLFRHRR